MDDQIGRFTQVITAQLKQSGHGSAHDSTKKIKLIIHVGTPKTGTTSVQTYLSKKQRKLRTKGILYPHNLEVSNNPGAPTHHWFEKNLVSTHVDNFIANVSNVITQIKSETHTVILSSEGIYNYWWDFPEASKNLLGELAKLFDVKLWVWFREPVSFMQSYYKQCIRNPKVASNPCYGKDLSFNEMLDIPWFAQHLDYQGFVTQARMIFGENSVSAFEYKGDIVKQVSTLLGLATAHDNPTPRQNTSLNQASITLLRAINHYDVKAKDKELLMPLIKDINSIMDRYTNQCVTDETAKQRVLSLVNPVTFSRTHP
ncbi:sulfotransferase family protein [Paraglaciecola chathamensis]|uniref:Sulfotransferase family protein n=1 Tax=Paraglaciecola chathamensis TaxID=368405 RepID=A0A8H9IEY7_9ALTE|nr:sulfotransferase family protein [Paraglaciecola oceanifecundans]GGZ68613.1 hypothetical protein GCM10011274_29040 [Paraglaciecola oceanifecundans]